MKKIMYLVSLVLFTFLTACNAGQEKIVIMEDLNNPSREEIRAKTQDQPNDVHPISNQAGIGSARKQFDKHYGENLGDLEIARYQGEFMIVTFEAHRAVNVQYQFAYKPGEPMSEAEILSYIQDRIPQDAVEIKRVNGNPDQEIIEYRSELLRNTLPEHTFREDEPGNFVVILNKNEQGQYSVIVTPGSAKN